MAVKFESALCECVLSGSSVGRTTIDILLVGEDKKNDVAHFAVLDDAAEFGLGFLHTGFVARVDHEDERVSSCWRCC